MEFTLGFVLGAVVLLALLLWWGYSRYRKARKAGMSRIEAMKSFVGGGGGPTEP